MDEIALIQAAQQGDLDAFNRLVLHYQDMAFNVAYRLLGEDASAADATQEAFIAAYRHLDRFRGGSFKAWLLRIVVNGSYDELRRQKRRPQTELEPENLDGEDNAEPAWLADPSAGPQELSERAELAAAIQRCLKELDDDFRSAVVLVDVQGLDYSEAAQIMKRPVGTVKSRLARARTRMQSCLQGFAELLPDRFRLKAEEA
ncbi:MAG: sigma-70 family RNA polymerase sigma factor [Anaerolineales bacterium]|nr:sigma-70 family RNA polymerase sigma factor [Anaerolineales bacterium]MCW5856507.1 sigma-70 family RNA polymerase sigma factor [Anaerolineales bacterium]